MVRTVKSNLHYAFFSCILCIGYIFAGITDCMADEFSQIEPGTFKFMKSPSATQECITYINKANVEFSMRNYKEGVNLLLEYEKKECALDSSDGQIFYNLGRIYEDGLGAIKNTKKAIQFYEQAAIKNNIESIYTLGYFYKYDATPVDYEQSAKWFQIGADLGDSECSAALGTLYFERKYKMVNIKKAYKLFQFASQFENPIALYCLGLMYCDGIGVKKNYKTAIQYFTRSANRGAAEAASYLSWIYLFNIKDIQPEKSLFWIQIALKLGYDDRDEVGLIMSVLKIRLTDDAIRKIQQEADDYYRTNLSEF